MACGTTSTTRSSGGRGRARTGGARTTRTTAAGGRRTARTARRRG